MRLTRLAIMALAAALPSCYDFHTVGPEDPLPARLPATVTVTVSYLRPEACVNTLSRCDGPVTFQASWMPLGGYLTLDQTAAHSWTATIANVPINFPGPDPYRVYVVDPFRRDSPTGGISAEHLVIGGELIVKFDNPGGTREQGLIFIDASGKGRTP